MSSDLPEGQQSKGSPNETAASVGASDLDGYERWVFDYLRRAAAHDSPRWDVTARDVVDRVRAEVAEEIALAIEARPRQQYENPGRDLTGQIVGGYRPGTAVAYNDAAEIAREHAGKRFESNAQPSARVWWLHRCPIALPDRIWVSEPTAADGARPERCGGCGVAAGEWFVGQRVEEQS